MMGIAELNEKSKETLLDINKMVSKARKQSETCTKTSPSGFKEAGWVVDGDITKVGLVYAYQPARKNEKQMELHVASCACGKGCSPISLMHPGVYGDGYKEVCDIIFNRKTSGTTTFSK